MSKGGKRPGAGRPRGAKSKATIERELRLQKSISRATEGISPLEVMLSSMRALWKEGQWAAACQIAKDVAPYVHPRLSAIGAQVDDGKDLIKQFMDAVSGSSRGLPNDQEERMRRRVSSSPGKQQCPAKVKAEG